MPPPTEPWTCCASPTGGALLPPVYETQDDLVATIRCFVRANAQDVSLTGAAVAAELGWSLRQIQARLQRIGTTPSMLIREERLELARLRLQHPGWAHRTVANIARSSGFSNASTFSNAYRERFRRAADRYPRALPRASRLRIAARGPLTAAGARGE